MEEINDNYIIQLFIRLNGSIETNNIIKLNKHKYSQDIESYLLHRYSDSESFTETIYRIYYKIENRPVCQLCGNPVKYLGKNKYRKHCSCSCSTKDKLTQEKLKQTNLQKYGYEYSGQSNIVKEKFKKTCIQKYGEISPLLNQEIKEKTKNTKLQKYGDEKYTNRNKANKTIKEKFGDLIFKTEYFKNKVKENNLLKYGVEYSTQRLDIKEKRKQTCLEKYGGNSPMSSEYVKEKAEQTYMKKYGVKNPYQIKEKHDLAIKNAQLPEIKEKRKQTCLEKYGVDNYFKTKENIEKSHSIESLNKRIETKRKNHTFNTSKIEIESYQLLKEKYPEVIYQYKSNKYPFVCDFYIPSLDLYIECNYHWTHGGKPYENTKEDNIIIENWKNKNTKYYNNAINCWTIRDVKKRKIAQENNLNYIEFWNIEQLKNWLNNKGRT